MTATLRTIAAHALAFWRRDSALLLPLSGLFVFVPQYAVLLLIPPMPANPPGGAMEAWSKALEPWVALYAGWYILAVVVAQYGSLAIVSAYAQPRLPIGGAMARAARLLLRSVLATLLVTLPCGTALLLSLGIPGAPLVVVPGIVYILARTVLTGAVVLGEPATGAAAAVVRSWRLTRGHALAVTLLVGGLLLAGQTLGAVVVLVERGVRSGPFANPVLLAMIDALAAGVTWAAAVALALVQVALYRRLAR